MKKQRELTMILGVIVLVFVLNFFVFRLAYLQEPIFLTHAYAFITSPMQTKNASHWKLPARNWGRMRFLKS